MPWPPETSPQGDISRADFADRDDLSRQKKRQCGWSAAPSSSLCALPIDVLSVIGKYACVGRDVVSLSKASGDKWREVWRSVLTFNLRCRQEKKRVEAMGALLALDGAERALPLVEERFSVDVRQHVKVKAAQHLTSIAITLFSSYRENDGRRVIGLLASRCRSRQMNVRSAVAEACRRLYEVGLEAEVRLAFGCLVSPSELSRWMLPDFKLIRPMEQWNFRQGSPVSPTRQNTARDAEAVVSLYVRNSCDCEVRVAAYLMSDANEPLEPPAVVPAGACLRWAYLSHDEAGNQDDSYYLASASPLRHPISSVQPNSDDAPLLGRLVVRGRGAVELEARRAYRSGFLVERWRFDHDGPRLAVTKIGHDYSDQDWPPSQARRPSAANDDSLWLAALKREVNSCRARAHRLAGQTDIYATQSHKNALNKLHLLDDKENSISPWLRGHASTSDASATERQAPCVPPSQPSQPQAHTFNFVNDVELRHVAEDLLSIEDPP